MSNFDWKSIVKTVAPMVGTALGGPLGGIAASALAKALGTSDAAPDTLAAAIQGATPEQLIAVQKAEDDFKLQMTQMGFNNVEALEKIASADRDSARNMAIQTKDWTPRVLAYVIAAIWILINGALLVMAIKHNPVDTGMQAIVTGVMKTIDAALMLVLGYYFGSSASSGAKDQLLYNSTPSSTGGQ